MKKHERKKPRRKEAIVRLEDLAPRKDPTGGSGKVLFGQDASRSGTKSTTVKRTKETS